MLAALAVLALLWAWRRAAARRLVRERRTVLVTGGGGGMGLATCRHLAELGDFVVVVDVNEQACLAAAQSIGEGRALALPFDVRKMDSVCAAAERLRALKGEGCLDAIVNFAGVLRGGPLVEMDPALLQLTMDINVVGTFNVNHAFFPLIRRGGQRELSARIVNVASEISYANISAAFTAPYSMSKFAVEAYTVGLRQELGTLRDPVHVITLNPGAIATDMVGSQLADSSNFFLQHARSRPDTLFRAQLEQGAKMAQAYMKAHQVPAQRIAEAIYAALHCVAPPDRVLVNVSLEMRLAALAPQRLLDWLYWNVL